MTKRNRRINGSDDFFCNSQDVNFPSYANTAHPGVKKFTIRYLNTRQKEYGRTIRENSIIFAIGAAGSGKTHLAALHAMDEFLSGRIDKIVVCRPVVNAGGEQLGFLPGTLQEKMDPYTRPIFDAFSEQWNSKQIQTMMEYGKIEIAPLAYMRGRTFRNSFIICDEAQNATDEQLIMLLSRLGENSKMIITGDPSQKDISGRPFEKARRKLAGIRGISFVDFSEDDVVRHPLVQQILRVWTPSHSDKITFSDEMPDDLGALPNFIKAPAQYMNGHAEGDD